MNIFQLEELNIGSKDNWSFNEVTQWLEKINMSEYSDIFTDSKIDGSMLMILEEDDLKEGLQIKNMMHRKRLMRALYLLKETQHTE